VCRVAGIPRKALSMSTMVEEINEGGKNKMDAKMNTKYDMPTQMPDVDEDGFLIDGEKWSADVAVILAKDEVQESLTEDHWKVIDCMRQFYHEYGTVPPVRMLSRNTELSLRRIKELFPSGLTNGACRIAGVPRATVRPNFLYP
jgi:tRNA 2-thiouridine synthesizing protein E